MSRKIMDISEISKERVTRANYAEKKPAKAVSDYLIPSAQS